jgi:hypothetical protein
MEAAQKDFSFEAFILRRLEEGLTALSTEAHQELNRLLLRLVLEHSGGNQVQAARILGISRQTLRAKRASSGSPRAPLPLRRPTRVRATAARRPLYLSNPKPPTAQVFDTFHRCAPRSRTSPRIEVERRRRGEIGSFSSVCQPKSKVE